MDSEHEEFKAKFPPGTKIVSLNGTPDNFETFLRCHCKNKEDFIEWLRHYQDLCKITFRVAVTRPRSGKTVLYKAVYRCQHNTYPNSHQRVKTPHKKHTDCPGLLRVTIKSAVQNRRVRSKDALRADYPTLINIIHKHNHKILAPEAVDVCRSQYSPVRSLDILKQDHLEGQDNITDSSIDLDTQTIYFPYYSIPKIEFAEEKSVQKCTEDNQHEPDWISLQDRFNLWFEKWKTNNSTVHYKALNKTITYLENCQTESSSISALRCFNKCFKAKTCDTQASALSTTKRKVLLEDKQYMQSNRSPKKSYVDHSYCKKQSENEKVLSPPSKLL